MASKPATTPQWDSNGTNLVVPTTQKTDGWAVGSTGVSSYMNWVLNLLYQWVLYVKDGVFVGEAGQSGLDATGGAGNTRGVIGRGVGNGTGVVGIADPAGSGHGVSGSGGLTGGYAIFGLQSTASGFAAVKGDCSGGNAEGVIGWGAPGKEGVKGLGGAGAPGVSGVGGTNQVGVQARKGSGVTAAVDTDGTVKFSGSNPASTFGAINEFSSILAPKAWMHLNLDGASGHTVMEGSNVASVSLPGSDVIRLTFAAKMADLQYAVFGRGTTGFTRAASLLSIVHDTQHDDGSGASDYLEFRLQVGQPGIGHIYDTTGGGDSIADVHIFVMGNQ